jgi:hypothetical protein
MRLKRRGDTKRDRRFGNAAQSFSGDADFCVGDFRGVWILEPPPADRTREVYFVVAVFVFGGGDWDWVGDVSCVAVRVFRAKQKYREGQFTSVAQTVWTQHRVRRGHREECQKRLTPRFWEAKKFLAQACTDFHTVTSRKGLRDFCSARSMRSD